MSHEIRRNDSKTSEPCSTGRPLVTWLSVLAIGLVAPAWVEAREGVGSGKGSPSEPLEILRVTLDRDLPEHGQLEAVGNRTRDERVNEILDRHGVASYRQAYPLSRLPELLDVYEIRCTGCDAGLMERELRSVGSFSDVRLLPRPVALDSGNPGGYDPADWMWYAHAQDWMWSLVRTEADLAWNVTTGDPNVLIAVVDNGFDADHDEFVSKMSPIDPCTGLPLVEQTHGTQTASIAAGETAEPGTAPEGMMPSVGFNSDVQGFMWGGTSAAHCAALGLDADVVSISWFSYCNPDFGGADQLAIQEILDSGTVIVAAAANGPEHCSGQEVFPFSGLYDERVIVVTSTNDADMHGDSVDTHSHYASVDLAAPGHGIMGATPMGGAGWGYFAGTGTSFAAPQVAGTVALMKSVNSCLKPADAQAILKKSTDPIADAASFPGLVGTGRLNVNRAVALTQALDYACPRGGMFDGANCKIGNPPAGTSAFLWNDNYYYTPLPGNSCPYPGSYFDGANCFVQDVPEGTDPFIWNNAWYYAACASGGWTAWLNRDNQFGSGDWELRSQHPSACAEPQAIQCRTRNGTYWTQSGDVNVTCDRNIGLICRNADQSDSLCENYEVRFYCP